MWGILRQNMIIRKLIIYFYALKQKEFNGDTYILPLLYISIGYIIYIYDLMVKWLNKITITNYIVATDYYVCLMNLT